MPEEKLITDASNISLNEQDQVQTILGKPPGWILRWGITFVFLSVMMLIWISWLVKFPDIIPARVMLTTEIPPVHLFVKIGGEIETLLVKDKQEVAKDDLLAIIKNPANQEDIFELEDFLNRIKNKNSAELAKVKFPVNLLLGNLQIPYATFTQNVNDYNFFQNKNENQGKIEQLRTQQSFLKEMNVSLQKQEVTMNSAIDLARKNWERLKTLQKEQAVSIQDVEKAKGEMLQLQRELERMQSGILNNKMRSSNLEVAIINLNEGRKDGKNEKSISLKENVNILLSGIENWKQQYLLHAPIDGIVSFPNPLNENQFFNSGDEIMTIVPADGVGEMTAKAWLPAANSGKVKENMVVNIRLDGYSYQEFGVVPATVKSKSLLPQEGNYLLELEMPKELVTTYGKKISFQQEMQGTGNIITEDRRIIERIFDQFLSLFKNR